MNKPDPPRLQHPLLVLDDGRPGHTHQARALALALADNGIDVPVAPFSLRQPWRALAPRLLSGASRGIRGSIRDRCERGQAAVGAGRRSALVGRWLQSAMNSRYVQILDPRIDPCHFDCVVAPEHDAIEGENVVSIFGALTAVTAHSLEEWRTQWQALERISGPRGVLLIGAPSARCRWDSRLLDDLVHELRDGGCRSLLISASRRTPRWALKWLASQRDAALSWPGNGDQTNPYHGLLAWGDAFAVTPDSVSMVSETLATGKCVVTRRHTAVGKIDRFLSEAANRGFILQHLDLDHRHPPLAEAQRIAPAVRTWIHDV